MKKRRILLVEPNYPIPPKSKNHKNFLPIGLLKIASYLRYKGDRIQLLRGIPNNRTELNKIHKFKPSQIWISSLFTYWSEYVKEAVQYYKQMFPRAKIVVGGIYASLMPKHCKEYTGCDRVRKGLLKSAEMCVPAYDLLENSNPTLVDYQILHASRGCKTKCRFCGTWKIEPRFEPKKTIKNEVKCRKIVFYDNNFLANPHIEKILTELIELKKRNEILWCESQSGFDGRELMDKPYLGIMMKKAGFRYPRIAWDWRYGDHCKIKKQIDILICAGYRPNVDISIFMLYNWDIPFEKMERKRIKCWNWHVQIADCRYRPLTQTFDHYNPHTIGQTNSDYYIHLKAGWTDALVKQFRSNVRRQNICIRHGFPFYSGDLERKRVKGLIVRKIKKMKIKKQKIKYLKQKGISYWFPSQTTYPSAKRVRYQSQINFIQ